MSVATSNPSSCDNKNAWRCCQIFPTGQQCPTEIHWATVTSLNSCSIRSQADDSHRLAKKMMGEGSLPLGCVEMGHLGLFLLPILLHETGPGRARAKARGPCELSSEWALHGEGEQKERFRWVSGVLGFWGLRYHKVSAFCITDSPHRSHTIPDRSNLMKERRLTLITV